MYVFGSGGLGLIGLGFTNPGGGVGGVVDGVVLCLDSLC